MSKADVSRFSRVDMIAYMTDCTLATVADMAMKKKVPKYEFQRQISIAQQGMDFLRFFGWDPVDERDYKSRPYDVKQDYDWSVEKYAERMRSKR